MVAAQMMMVFFGKVSYTVLKDQLDVTSELQ